MKKNRVYCNFGINDADYTLIRYEEQKTPEGKRYKKLLWKCPFYSKWTQMITRCYSEKALSRRPTYTNCKVCEDWKLFSNFRAWMEKQDWEGKELDKDLLGNGRLYSPDNCCFISQKLNSFLKSYGKINKTGYRGVSFDKTCNKYIAQISNPFHPGKEYLGHFNTAEDAGNAWLKRKLELLRVLANKENDPRVVEKCEMMLNFNAILMKELEERL